MSQSYLEYPSAGFFPRIAAMGYDTLILMAIWVLISGIHTAILGEPSTTEPSNLQFTLFPFLLAGTFAFYAWFWTHGGQTIGMRAWRLKVVHENLDGTPITLLQCAIRMIIAMFSLFSFAMGYLWVLVNSTSDTWHDTASRTRTIRLPKPSKKH